MAGTPQDAGPDRPELQAVTVPVIDIGPLRDPDYEGYYPPSEPRDRIEPIEVGPWSLEVWRTNWPDAISGR